MKSKRIAISIIFYLVPAGCDVLWSHSDRLHGVLRQRAQPIQSGDREPGRVGAIESTGRGICQETQHHAVLGQSRQRRVHEIAQGQAGGHDHGARAGGREKGRGRRLGDQAGADRVERVLYRRPAGMTRPGSRRPRPPPRPIRSSPTASPNFSPAGTTPGPTRRKWMPGRKPISSLPATGTS